jgi:hypothetical protein
VESRWWLIKKKKIRRKWVLKPINKRRAFCE